MFGITYLDEKGMHPLDENDAVLLLQVAERYLTSPIWLKIEFPVKLFYAAAKKYVNALHILCE